MANKSQHRARREITNALSTMTVDAVEAKEARQKALRPMASGDTAQIFQVPVNGKVGKKISHVDFRVTFADPFIMQVGPTQTDMLYDWPQFTSGIQMQSKRPILMDVQVLEYGTDNAQFVTSAKCRLFAWSPEARRKFDFHAMVHLTFIGFSAPQEDETDG